MTFDHKTKTGSSRAAPASTTQPVQRVKLRAPAPLATAPVVAAPVARHHDPFTLSNSRSASSAVQRARVAPALTAAGLLAADRTAMQRATSEVQASQAELEASRIALAERGLRPESETALQRFVPPPSPAPTVLTALQRQLATETGQQQVTGAFMRDAQVLPAATRAELAMGALQRAVGQGADGPALYDRLSELTRTPQDQEAVQRAVSLQRQKEAREAQVREGYTLQRAHLGLQRRLDEAVQRQTEANLGTVTQRVQARRGGGEPLPAAVQRHLEQGLNADLSRVRVHTDGEAAKLAASVQAEAFTSGQDIYFGANRYDPTSADGLKLVAHEATHTVQQVQGKVSSGVDPDAGLEVEARRIGEVLGSAPLATAPVPATASPQSAGSPGPSAVQRKAAEPLLNHDTTQKLPRAPWVMPGGPLPAQTPKTVEASLEQQIARTTVSQSADKLTDLLRTLNSLQTAQKLQETAKLYQSRTGRSLHNDLQAAFYP
ncbi:DUF4157 domain-containing protein [Deinococcus carri]|uniref:eCIS core domain-containing protein n=1 Tax=Deinococcus carri TaxID=1211323 RepID=UPI0031EE3757